MQGQANHFVRYAPEQIEYGIKRYTNETKRLYGCIEKHLASGKDWLAADQYTIADMANYAWIAWHDWAGEPQADTNASGTYNLKPMQHWAFCCCNNCCIQ